MKCVEVFLNKSTLEEHNKICKSNDRELKAYLDTLTYPNNIQTKRLNRGKTFVCTQYDYKCAGKENMKIHMGIHNKEKPYKCNECDYKGTGKEELITHMDTHKGENTYICHVDGCDYDCKYIHLLNKHKETHKKKWSDVAKSSARNNQAPGKQTLDNTHINTYQTRKPGSNSRSHAMKRCVFR